MTAGTPPQVLKACDVAVEPGGAVLAPVGAHHVARGVGQAGAEQLHHGVDPGDAHHPLAEVDLGFGAGVVGQRDGDAIDCLGAVVAHPLPHRGSRHR